MSTFAPTGPAGSSSIVDAGPQVTQVSLDVHGQAALRMLSVSRALASSLLAADNTNTAHHSFCELLIEGPTADAAA